MTGTFIRPLHAATACAAASLIHAAAIGGFTWMASPEGPQAPEIVILLAPPPPPPRSAAPEEQAPSIALPQRFDQPRVVDEYKLLDDKTREALQAPGGGDPGLGVVGVVAGGSAGGVLGGMLREIAHSTPALLPPPPPPAKAAPPPEPEVITVPGAVQEARLIHRVLPEYPQPLVRARVQGTVRLLIRVGKDGLVKSVEVVGGPPLLVRFAERAVAQWRFQPTTLRGKPVEVSSLIDVNFRIEDGAAR